MAPPREALPIFYSAASDAEAGPVYGVKEDLSSLSPGHPVVWTQGVKFARTQSPEDARQDPAHLSTRDKVVFLLHQLEQGEARPIRRAFSLLRADARHYVVSFVVGSEREFESLSKLYDEVVLPAARSSGLRVGSFLRSGYTLHSDGVTRIEIHAYGETR